MPSRRLWRLVAPLVLSCYVFEYECVHESLNLSHYFLKIWTSVHLVLMDVISAAPTLRVHSPVVPRLGTVWQEITERAKVRIN